MVPSASRSVRYGVPLGKAARATRTVSGGTGAMGCGRSDMTDVLIHVEACGQLLWGYYAIACVPRRTLSAPTTCLKAFEILQIIVRRQYRLSVMALIDFDRSAAPLVCSIPAVP